MITPKLILALTAIASLGHQDQATFTSAGTRIVLTHADQGNMDFPKGQKERHLTVTGNPVQVQALEKGLTARGHILDFTWAELDPKTTEIRKGRIEGAATIVVDGAAARKAQEEDAQILHKKLPPAPLETSVLQIDSELLTYSGTVKGGTVTMPSAWTLKQISQGIQEQKTGKKLKIKFDQTLDADGVSGTMDLVPGKDKTINRLESGHLEGPVHFKIVRHETPEGATVTNTTVYTGVADHVDIDLKSNPGTITAEGHVIVDADEDGFISHFSEDKFVFLVNDKLEPQGIKFFGKPGATTAKSKDGTK